MFEYTYENHFRFGYKPNRFFTNRSTFEEEFTAFYGRSKRLISSWREANLQASLEIYNKSKGPIWILFSGGVDSEICLRSFLEARVPVKVAHLRYQDGSNDHDTNFVRKFARQHGLEVVYFDLNTQEFFESSLFYRIVDKTQCVSPIIACHLWLCDQLDGTPIIAQGEPHLKKDIPNDYVPGVSPYRPSPWRLVESERLCSLYKHFIFDKRPAIPGFFQYLPEQIFSYLQYNPLMKRLIDNQVIGKLGTRSSKNEMSYQFYPELEPRQKYTGFENLVDLHDSKRSELAQRFPSHDQNVYLEYSWLIQELAPESFQ